MTTMKDGRDWQQALREDLSSDNVIKQVLTARHEASSSKGQDQIQHRE